MASGSKRSFGDLEDDIFGTKKGRTKEEEAALGVATEMILSLRERLQSCKDDLASCQNELESAKTEIQKWKSAFEKESYIPHGKSPEPGYLIDHIQSLKSSEKSLKEQVEIAQMKLAIRDLYDELKLKRATHVDPETDIEQGSAATGPSCNEVEVDKGHGGKTGTYPALLEELRAAKAVIAEMEEIQAVKMVALAKAEAENARKIDHCSNIMTMILEKYPTLVPPPTSAPVNDAHN